MTARGRPQARRQLQRIDDAAARPPGPLIARAVQLVVMHVAQRQRELVGDLEAHRARLRELQMMRLGGSAPAHQAGLRGDKRQMRLVPDALLLRDGQRRGLITLTAGEGVARLDPRAASAIARGSRFAAPCGLPHSDRRQASARLPAITQQPEAVEVLLPEGVKRFQRRERPDGAENRVLEGLGLSESPLGAGDARRISTLGGGRRGRGRRLCRG